ncbi:ParB/RepB/Spo0J family partition protein [Sulfitobacter sp. M220]|uniref:ParB/RepB/Spo0J family partition protein n=1 Tax=Sulfitobacter sp. M220 TaxID=2675333 RepID=UPI001F02A16F|nr:ParB/RepB/Spo0J family partition protein [Sulfitobacter sp. M220]MCF7779313.1 ParB/RepB/Spo0J family partition protein [Sulfitobacter sp. M220]
MARKLLGAHNEHDQKPVSSDDTEEKEERGIRRPSRIMRPPIKGGVAAPRYIEGSTQSLVERTHEDISVNQIQDSAIQDRIDLSYGIEDLMASLEKDGQKVPIIVRIVNGDKPYEVVAGRRRLEATRRLGHKTIRGFIHTMSDVDAFRLQGIENNQRVETSFIERARTAHQAHQAGIEQQEVAEFLGISMSLVSVMRRIFIDIGEELATSIGPAAGIGRRKWEALTDAATRKGLSSYELSKIVDKSVQDSTERFETVYKHVTDFEVKTAPEITAKPGSSNGEMTQYDLPAGRYVAQKKQRVITIKAGRGATTEFIDFLDEKLPGLVEEFISKTEDNS